MKKLIPLLVIPVIVGALWLFATERRTPESLPVTTTPTPATAAAEPLKLNTGDLDGDTPGEGALTLSTPTSGSEQEAPVKPAAQAYSSAQEALAAVLKGAKDYDDSILEQFNQPGADCSWCPEFYQAVRDLIARPDTAQDQKSYLAEIMAISGKVENVQDLAESIKNAKTPEDADLFAQALELSVGKDDVTRFLGDQMNSTNETLQEASVAAVTNQGSRLAVELLIKNTVERGDPDGYYSRGTGVGELIPEEEAIPPLQAMVQNRDQYSHLGVKSLLNSGMEGLRIVFDELENSKDPEADKKLLKDALDHVNYDDGMDSYIQQKLESKSPAAREFAQQIKAEFSDAGNEDAGDENSPVQGQQSTGSSSGGF
jgi:hypothetical protein